MPSDKEVEANLRSTIRARFGKEELTVNSVRAIAKQELDLDNDFFDNATWKAKSKTIIKDQIEKCQDGDEPESVPEEEVKPVEKKKSLKRSSPAQASRPRKKSKIAEDDDEESTTLSEPPASGDESVEDIKSAKKSKASKPKQQTQKSKPKPKSRPKDDSASELSDAPEDESDQNISTEKADEADDTSSELSSVIDDPDPPRKKGKVKNGDTKQASKAKKPAKSKPAEADPNAEEIKKLQAWLVKCGIRKVWGKELKPYETSKAKISHLKSMLADVGMTGRYSNEKAAQIKEARELAADIEAVQEGNERWGKASGDESEEQGRPKRRLKRGAQNYDFLSSDGEETD